MNRSTFHSDRRSGVTAKAFSLIELLTVIAIIAVLAGIGAGMAGVAVRKQREAATRTGLKRLEVAIESYKADLNQYPPDNSLNGTNANPALNQLYYELGGSVSTTQGNNYTNIDGQMLTSAQTASAFNSGLLNVVASGRPKTYLQNLRDSERGEVCLDANQNPRIRILVAPVTWPAASASTNPPPLKAVAAYRPPGPVYPELTVNAQLRLNPWCYVSTRPTNNPASYDLWADIYIGKQFRRIANWNP